MASGGDLRASVFGDPVPVHPDRTLLSLRVVLPRCRHTSILLVRSGASTSTRAVHYSVPAQQVRAGQRVQLQVDGEVVTIRAIGAEGAGWLATHPRARQRGSWVVDQSHWDGLP
ncbi:Mu transposase domain-containing protein, partial [Rhodococcus sp. (in: high G+C Gram-positive bacteria)]|uniref:Mu transposase domain-containing protein n=1 Tax=Rhodococcus sp. TaxID=1831 RepID=UPI003BAE5468